MAWRATKSGAVEFMGESLARRTAEANQSEVENHPEERA
jgi:hypothetical protein